jgi:hypothetical protein
MSRGEYGRTTLLLFRVVKRMLATQSDRRRGQLLRTANRLAKRLAGHDLPNLFGGTR